MEGAKTSSWLNKKGMNVTKSKFASEAGAAALDIDDPLFWQKVMPDFITPDILLNKIDEMEEAFKKPTRGRPGKKKKAQNKKATEGSEEEESEEESSSSEEEDKGLSRGNIKKVSFYPLSGATSGQAQLTCYFSIKGQRVHG